MSEKNPGLNENRELSDDELTIVTGGAGGGSDHSTNPAYCNGCSALGMTGTGSQICKTYNALPYNIARCANRNR